MSNIWVISPYSFEFPDDWQRVWEHNLKEGFISIGWAALGNVSKMTLDQIKKRHSERWENSNPQSASWDSNTLYNFWHRIEEKDIVVARRGRKAIAAVGKVIGRPYYNISKTRKVFGGKHAYPNHIDIKWQDDSRDMMFDRQVFGMRTLQRFDASKLELLINESGNQHNGFLDEIDEEPSVAGGVKRITVNAYERDPKARAACVRHHGFSCKACDMSFAEVYGERGIDHIHVHHVQPVSTLKSKCTIDPARDLVPVCANCHEMLHRGKELLTVAELRSIIKKVKKSLVNRRRGLWFGFGP
jgi:predicted HNH restriction endonuclease